MTALCTATLLGIPPDVVLLLGLAWFGLSLAAVIASLFWLRRRASRPKVLPFRLRPSGTTEPTERAGAPDPRYDPKQFRSER